MTEHALDGGILNIPASDTSILIVDKSDTIDSILVSAYNVNRTNQFNVFWDSLTPENLIDNYGTPSRIWLQSSNLSGEAGPPKEQMYVLWLFYDSLGFLVRYTGFVKNTRIFRFCLSLRDKGNLGTAIHLYLKSPKDHTLLENLAKNDIGYAEGIKLIDKISSFTTTKFSDSFMSSRNSLKCFSVSRSIWRL